MNCEDCSVDIDIDKLVVSFSLCCNLNDSSDDDEVDDDGVDCGGNERVSGDFLNGHTNDYHNEFDSPVASTAPPIYIHG